MVELVNAKCPSCGATLKLSKDNDSVECEYCHSTIIVNDAIASYKLKVSGSVSVEGIPTDSDLIESANKLVSMNEYLKAKRKFLEFSEKCPDNYQGWLGLLICRTRNFTIRDNNAIFENDINKYYDHFLRVAPEDVKSQYCPMIENYLHPQMYQGLNQNTFQNNGQPTSTNMPQRKNTWLWVLGWIFCFPIPATILIGKSKMPLFFKAFILTFIWFAYWGIGSAMTHQS